MNFHVETENRGCVDNALATRASLSLPQTPLSHGADQKPGNGACGSRASERCQHLQHPGRPGGFADAQLLGNSNACELRYCGCVGEVAERRKAFSQAAGYLGIFLPWRLVSPNTDLICFPQ
jgi:hypothetical protein